MRPLRLGQDERLIVGATSSTSSIALSGVSYFRLIVLTGGGVHIKVGVAPVALNTNTYLARGIAEYFRISVGERVALIRESTNSIVILTWMYLY